MDEIDRDQCVNEHFLQILISQAGSRQTTTPAQSFCLQCGVLIPEKRRQLILGVRLCVICQTREEQQR